MRRALFVYLVLLHVAVGGLVLRDRVVERLAVHVGMAAQPDHPFIVQMRGQQARLDPAIPAGAILFLGDSNMQSMPVEEVAPNAVNLGIGWQRSDQLLASMLAYHAMQRAAAVVIMIGTNDVNQGREPRFREVLAAVPSGVHVVLVSAPPIAGVDMQRHAAAAARACVADARCSFVDGFSALSGKPGVLLADGVHLSPAGYTVLVPLLHDALVHVTQSRTSSSWR